MVTSGSFTGQRRMPPEGPEEPEFPVAAGVPTPETLPDRVDRRGWLLAVPGSVLMMAWMYALTVHANSTAVNSDGATVVLQGQAVASGNVLLHGWILSLDSWWTLDVACYGILTSIVGVQGYLLLAGPALIAGLVVIVGAVIARRGRRGTAAAVGMVTVAAVLALPTHTLASYLMCGPIHVSTALCALVAFWGLRRNRYGRGWLLAVGLLCAGMLGDLQMLSYGVVPALVAGGAAAARRRSVRAGGAALSAAVCSVVLALIVRTVVVALGGFSLGATNRVASAQEMVANVVHLVPDLGQLLGLGDSINGSGGVPFALQSVHVLVAALLTATLATGVVRLVGGVRHGRVPPEPPGPVSGDDPEPWRLDDLLVAATLGATLNFVILAGSATGYLRYLTATVIFGAVLAGRYVTLWWSLERPVVQHRTASAVGAVTTACFLAASAVQLGQPAPSPPAVGLATFLEAHELTSGIGDFWVSSLTTVESGGTVAVRPVVPGPDATLEAYNKGDDPGWFAGHSFQFVVYPGTTADSSPTQVSLRTASATWGRPSATYHVAGYVVLIWSHPVTVTRFESRL